VPKILLDTNTYSLFKRENSEDTKLILEYADEIGMPNVVIAELYAGFLTGQNFRKTKLNSSLF
jgi:predicted nucleic acid-binding protein